MRPRRPPLVALTTTEEVLAALRTARLLSRRQVRQLREEWGSAGEPRRQLAELVRAGVLTTYQAEQVHAGKARGLLLGPYRILEQLAAGGMGQVYKAEHRLMKRVVALKVVARAPALPGGSRPRFPPFTREGFRREAKAAALLCHPHIVTADDAGRSRGRLYLVMEYVEGTDLERLVRRTGPLSVPLACEVVRQAARALQHVHERGLVHRDVKPANLVLAHPPGAGPPEGRGTGPEEVVVKLLDLGLVQPAGAEDDLSGTPDYMAPERGQEAGGQDIRGDLYSLGCTFYFLLTGRVPFPGGTPAGKLLKHRLDTPTPLQELCPEVPSPVRAMVERLMAREMGERYPDPAAVAAALERQPAMILSPGPAAGRQPASGRRRRVLSLGLAATAVLAGVLVSGSARWPGGGGMAAVGSRSADPRTVAEAGFCSFVVEGSPGAFATLAEAVDAAGDGATVTIHGTGPVRMVPLSWQGKALVLRAAPGARPCLEAVPLAGQPWQALLATDRALILEGLELRQGTDGAGAGERFGGPLVAVEGAALHLSGCRLESSGKGPLVILRNGSDLVLKTCQLEGGALALSVEVGQGPACRVCLEDSTLQVHAESGAAVSLWAAEGAGSKPVELELRGNHCAAGRVVALRAVAGPLRVRAVGNHFCFREALLSCAGYPAPNSWRRATTWQDRDNHYDGTGPWLRIEGESVSVWERLGWQRLWDAR